MSKLNLGLDSRKVFGEYLPSVFINKIIIAYPTDSVTGIPNKSGDILIDVELEINITKPSDMDLDIQEWISLNMDQLFLYTFLSPYGGLNAQLEESTLNFAELFAAKDSVSMTPGAFTAASPAAGRILDYIKDAFINDWFPAGTDYTWGPWSATGWTDTERAVGLAVPDRVYNSPSAVFWGTTDCELTDGFYLDGVKGCPLNFDGPWDTDGSAEPSCYIEAVLPDVLSFFTLSTDDLGTHSHTIKLADLAAGEHGAIINSQTAYDKEGNEIVRITNIALQFTYAASTSDDIRDFITASLESIEKLFLVCVVGTAESDIAGLRYPLFNVNFGDISYEHILKYNMLPDPEYQIFMEIKTEDVFNGKPIQTFNKKYYVPDPINQKTIVDNLKILIANSQKWAEKDSTLAQNIQNLEALLASKEKAIDLMPELYLYTVSYPNKDLGSKSGKFFNAFRQIITSYNEIIAHQPQLAKKLIINDRLIDQRPPPLNYSYWPPTPIGSPTLADGTTTNPDYPLLYRGDGSHSLGASEDYIPNMWAMMSRYAEQTIPTYGLLADFVEYAVGEGLATPTEYTTGWVWDYNIDAAQESFAEMNSSFMYTRDSQQTSYYTDTVVGNKGTWIFDWEKALHKESWIANVINVRKLQELFHLTIPYKYFRVHTAEMVRNEAELQLQNDPDWSDSTWRNDSSEFVRISQKAIFDEEKDYPATLSCEYSYDPDKMKYGQPFVYTLSDPGGDVDMEEATAIVDPLTGGGPVSAGGDSSYWWWAGTAYEDAVISSGAGSRILLPGGAFTAEWASSWTTATEDIWESVEDFIIYADTMTLGARSSSFLRFCNFDVCDDDTYSRLDGFNSYDTGFEYTSTLGPRDGYRVITLQYRDYMDDDVAYYNTWGSYVGDRNPEWAFFLSTGDTDEVGSTDDLVSVWTNYVVDVFVTDRTLKFFTADLYPYFESIYASLLSYQEQAGEICNFNNLTGRFNDFFAEAMLGRYEGTHYPWTRAAYVYWAMRDLFTMSFSSSHSAAIDWGSLLEYTRRTIYEIGPESGSLDEIESFRLEFERILNIIKPSGTGIGAYHPVFKQLYTLVGSDGPESDTTDEEVWEIIMDSENHLEFSNIIPIVKMIHGNLALGAFWDDALPDPVPATCEYDPVTDGITPDWLTPAGWLACMANEFDFLVSTSVSSASPWHACRPESILTQAFIYEFWDELQDAAPAWPAASHPTSVTAWIGSNISSNPLYSVDNFADFLIEVEVPAKWRRRLLRGYYTLITTAAHQYESEYWGYGTARNEYMIMTDGAGLPDQPVHSSCYDMSDSGGGDRPTDGYCVASFFSGHNEIHDDLRDGRIRTDYATKTFVELVGSTWTRTAPDGGIIRALPAVFAPLVATGEFAPLVATGEDLSEALWYGDERTAWYRDK